jgi:GNAT superfamily N-acetyltransferase
MPSRPRSRRLPGSAIRHTCFADHLRSLPASFRLFAAVDEDRAVRATSASGRFGTEATVIFVNTDPEWRGRGIGQAMTAAALRSARDCGALRAGLDASAAGARIYLRLGFQAITRTTRFSYNHRVDGH